MQPDTLIICALALAALLAVAGVLVLALRLAARPGPDERASELAAVRQHVAELERLLAVEQHRTASLGGLQEALAAAQSDHHALRASASRVDSDLAVARETARQDELRVAELRLRLGEAEIAHAGLLGRIATLTADNAELGKVHAHEAALVVAKERALGDCTLRLQETDTRLRESEAEQSALQSQVATLTETLEQERRHSAERLRDLHEVRDSMTKEFRLLADGVMERHGETFSKQNKEQIDVTLAPLREKLVEFQQGLQTAHTESEKERARLGEQIRALSETSAKMTLETHNLTQALKGKAHTQGAWGEMILASILEKCGLRIGHEYSMQDSHRGEDGQLLRTDVVVRLPDGRNIIIDSKVSMTAFEAYVSGETDDDRIAALARHSQSLRSHVKTLASKAYQATSPGSLDFAIMFVPIEGAYAPALQVDAELTGFAVENNVCIASPATLMAVLRTANHIWNIERRNQNAAEIAMRAGRMYDKFVGFVDDMTKLGISLDGARARYGDAMAKLSTGNGNIVRQVQQLRELGAKTSKALPAGLLDHEAEPVRTPALAAE